MKRIFSMLVLGAGLVALGGCPIYGDGGGNNPACASNADCPSGTTCDVPSGTCYGGNPGGCTSPNQCVSGQTCGSDGYCHVGDCSQVSCVSGYTCTLVSGTPTCVSNGTNPDGGTPPECNNDAACSSKGVGAKCLDGTCVIAANQCNDATQCNSGDQCVQGVCTPSCGPSSPCPTGYSCDTSKGVCTGNPTPCNSTTDCSGGDVCVDTRCVAPCSSGSCPSGEVCVGGGCIPDQKPQFVCSVEGTQDACASGSLCLHHSCYIACSSSSDGGMQCKSADTFNVCKQVVTASGQYNVCGSTSNLGPDCDPTIGKNCAGALICIDGFCR